MRTTFPRRSAAVKGGELSHPVAPPREGNSPSTGSLGCIAASKSCFAFTTSAFHLGGCTAWTPVEKGCGCSITATWPSSPPHRHVSRTTCLSFEVGNPMLETLRDLAEGQ